MTSATRLPQERKQSRGSSSSTPATGARMNGCEAHVHSRHALGIYNVLFLSSSCSCRRVYSVCVSFCVPFYVSFYVFFLRSFLCLFLCLSLRVSLYVFFCVFFCVSVFISFSSSLSRLRLSIYISFAHPRPVSYIFFSFLHNSGAWFTFSGNATAGRLSSVNDRLWPASHMTVVGMKQKT